MSQRQSAQGQFAGFAFFEFARGFAGLGNSGRNFG